MQRACSKWVGDGISGSPKQFLCHEELVKEGETGALCPYPEAEEVEGTEVCGELSWALTWAFSSLFSRKSGLALGESKTLILREWGSRRKYKTV